MNPDESDILRAENARLRAEIEALLSTNAALENDAINANGNMERMEAELSALRADIEAGRLVRKEISPMLVRDILEGLIGLSGTYFSPVLGNSIGGNAAVLLVALEAEGFLKRQDARAVPEGQESREEKHCKED